MLDTDFHKLAWEIKSIENAVLQGNTLQITKAEYKLDFKNVSCLYIQILLCFAHSVNTLLVI